MSLPIEYLYHSFPRRAANAFATTAEQQLERGVAILRSMVEDGLLLTPERTKWQETRLDGSPGAEICLLQRRFCFTHLQPHELIGHAEHFGAFALEYHFDTIRAVAGVPVFYLPNPPVPNRTAESIGPALMSRLEEAQRLLSRLGRLVPIAEAPTHLDGAEVEEIFTNGPSRDTRLTVGAVKDLLEYLQRGMQPVHAVHAAVQGLSGFFYALEDEQRHDRLTYYRQREWRIVSNITSMGSRLTRKLTEAEAARVRAVDPEFFDQEQQYPPLREEDPPRRIPRIAECELLTSIDGHHPLETARRLIVPQAAIREATEVVARLSIPPRIDVFEDLEATA